MPASDEVGKVRSSGLGFSYDLSESRSVGDSAIAISQTKSATASTEEVELEVQVEAKAESSAAATRGATSQPVGVFEISSNVVPFVWIGAVIVQFFVAVAVPNVAPIF